MRLLLNEPVFCLRIIAAIGVVLLGHGCDRDPAQLAPQDTRKNDDAPPDNGTPSRVGTPVLGEWAEANDLVAKLGVPNEHCTPLEQSAFLPGALIDDCFYEVSLDRVYQHAKCGGSRDDDYCVEATEPFIGRLVKLRGVRLKHTVRGNSGAPHGSQVTRDGHKASDSHAPGVTVGDYVPLLDQTGHHVTCGRTARSDTDLSCPPWIDAEQTLLVRVGMQGFQLVAPPSSLPMPKCELPKPIAESSRAAECAYSIVALQPPPVVRQAANAVVRERYDFGQYHGKLLQFQDYTLNVQEPKTHMCSWPPCEKGPSKVWAGVAGTPVPLRIVEGRTLTCKPRQQRTSFGIPIEPAAPPQPTFRGCPPWLRNPVTFVARATDAGLVLVIPPKEFDAAQFVSATASELNLHVE